MGDKQSSASLAYADYVTETQTVTEFYENVQNVVQQKYLERKTITGVLAAEEFFDDDDHDSTSDLKFVYFKAWILVLAQNFRTRPPIQL